jgi:L-seryl-tRNA(Ser) seleniumtransferase
MRHFTRPVVDIRGQAERVLPRVQAALPQAYTIVVVETECQIGSGALPIAGIASAGLQVSHGDGDAGIRRLAAAIRRLPQPVIGRIHKGKLLLDMRCLDKEKEFTAQLPLLDGLLQ